MGNKRVKKNKSMISLNANKSLKIKDAEKPSHQMAAQMKILNDKVHELQ
jgi:hypothetical protein